MMLQTGKAHEMCYVSYMLVVHVMAFDVPMSTKQCIILPINIYSLLLTLFGVIILFNSFFFVDIKLKLAHVKIHVKLQEENERVCACPKIYGHVIIV